MKKFAAILAAATAASLMLTACGSKEIEVDPENLPSYEELSSKAYDDKAYVKNLDLDKLVELSDYKGIEVSVEKVHVNDEDVENYITSQLAANPNEIEITDRPAADGDHVIIDFVGLLDGEEFDGGSSDDYELVLGSNSFIEGFEDGVIGMEIGEEKDLDLTFPENYGNADLAGVDVTFVVTLDRIFVEEAAELNDEWVAAQGITDVSTVDEYRERVHQMYLEADELRYDGDISNKVFNHVIENSKYKGDYSELKQRYFDTMLKNDANQAAYYGEELGTFIMLYYGMTVEDYIDNMKTSAELTAKQAMVVEQIAAAEGIEVTEEDVNEDMQVYADYYGYTLEEYKELSGDMTEDPDYMSFLLIDKVLKYLNDQAVVTEVEPAEEAETETETAE